MAATTKIMMEEIKGVGQRDINGYTEDCFIFYGCLSSKKSAEATMYVGSDTIGVVKTNTKGLYKDTIENLTKDCPVNSYLVLRSKPMLPRGRPLIAVGYKYKSRKVLYFIVI